MDLGTENDMTDAIGVAERESKTEVATMLERFKSDAAKTRSEVRQEFGITGQYHVLHSYFIRTIEISFSIQISL